MAILKMIAKVRNKMDKIQITEKQAWKMAEIAKDLRQPSNIMSYWAKEGYIKQSVLEELEKAKTKLFAINHPGTYYDCYDKDTVDNVIEIYERAIAELNYNDS